MLEIFELVPIAPALSVYGEVKALLEERGLRLDDFDLLIGATALEAGMKLVTNNTRHLARIPGLDLEDWK